MGYFSNGTEGELYREAYCDKCIFDREQRCPIWNLHLALNYADCNDPHSPLHKFIPRSKDGCENMECFFFMPAPSMGLALEQPDRDTV